jgi:hypothetical protein
MKIGVSRIDGRIGPDPHNGKHETTNAISGFLHDQGALADRHGSPILAPSLRA